MSLFVIGSFFAFITASNATVTPTVIAPAISQQAQDWLGSLNSANQDLKKQHVVRTVSLKVNHQRQESIAKIEADYKKSKEEFLQTIKVEQSLAQEAYIQEALSQEAYIQQSPISAERLSAGISRSWTKTEKIADKAIEKIKSKIDGIKLKFDNSQFADDELFPQGIDAQMFGDEAFNDPRSYTQKEFDEESKEEIEQSIKDALLEVDQELAKDFKNELAFAKRSSLRVYRHDPSFMELNLSQMDQLKPGIKRDFKDFLFSKKVFTKEQMQKLFNDLESVKQELNLDQSTVNIDSSEDGMIKQIDDFNKIKEQNLESLYLNYPEFAELQKKIKHQQKLISINNDLLDNKQDLIDLIESYQEDELTVRKKRSVYADNPGSSLQEILAATKSSIPSITQDLQAAKTELADLQKASATQHPVANAAIDRQIKNISTTTRYFLIATFSIIAILGAAVIVGLTLFVCLSSIALGFLTFIGLAVAFVPAIAAAIVAAIYFSFPPTQISKTPTPS